MKTANKPAAEVAETRYLRVNTPQGCFTEAVTVVRLDKRGLLVEVPGNAWFPWKKKFVSGGDRFYVAPTQARKSR